MRVHARHPRRLRYVAGFITVAVAASLVAALAPLPAPGGPGPAHAHHIADSFVTRSGGELMVDGQPFTFTGVNIYNANSDGWCREALSDVQLGQALDDVGLGGAEHGVLRAWFFQTLATDKTTKARDWTRFDRTLAIAKAKGYKVIATLVDQWGECGTLVAPTYGYKTEAWYTGGYAAPDPAQSAPTAYGPTWKSYRDWAVEMVTRYRDDPTILAWQLINEAEVNPNGAFQACPPGDATRDTLIAWATDMSDLVRSIDPNHLISLGTIGSGQCGTDGPQFQAVHDLPNIDLCEVHDYSPTQAIPGDEWNGFGLRVQQCAALDKPLIVGEVGIKPPSVGGSYLDRALAFRAKLVAQTALGVDGIVAWNFWPNGSTPADYDIGPTDPALAELAEPGPHVLVNTTDDTDDGTCDATHCSLREAIATANARAGADLLAFAIPGSGVRTITPSSPLPALTDTVLIDGSTQPGTVGSPLIAIDGSAAGAGANGLAISGPDVAVRGIRVTGFAGSGIRVTGSGARIEEVRLDGNGNDGVTTVSPATYTTITRNRIFSNGDLGIDVGDDGPSMGTIGGPVGPPPPPEPFLVNAPTDVVADATTGRVTGRISGLAGTYRVEVFRAQACDPSIYGEGDVPVGAVSATIPGPSTWGTATFEVPLGGGLVPGQIYTATATNPGGTTSEFSFCAVASSGPQVWTVTTTDPGFDLTCDANCTLIDALGASILAPGSDTVRFAVPGAGPHHFDLPYELQFDEPITIDGTSQPGYAGTPLVVIDGSTAAGASGLVLRGGSSTVKGISIGGFDDFGHAAIVLASDGNRLEANHIGLDPTGTIATPNWLGVHVLGSDNVIGGTTAAQRNVISGNANHGIQVGAGEYPSGAARNRIIGNHIGTDISGTVAIGNSFDGIEVNRAPDTEIGGAAPGEGNVLSGNAVGVVVAGVESAGTTIQGNLIGTDPTGTSAVPNGTGILTSYIDGVVIGGTAAGQGNVISGNTGYGIQLGTESEGIDIAGNRIGTRADGLAALGNGGDGVFVSTGNGATADTPNRIGVGGVGNVISGNGLSGVSLAFTSRPAVVLTDNFVGLGADGTTPVPNTWHGIWAGQELTHAWVGTDDPTEANVIAHNGGDAISVRQGATGVRVGVNVLRDNVGLGIDLGDDGPTANDPGDVDGGDNHLQNAPVLGSVSVVGAATVVAGAVSGPANVPQVVHVYVSDACDPTGYGEAGSFLGTAGVVPVDAAGDGAFSISLPVVPVGATVTAQAIAIYASGSELLDVVAETSELSACATASAGPVATPVGTDVAVSPPVAAGSVDLTFDEVTAAGETTATSSASPPALPAGFALGDPPTYYDITTTATFTGQVEVCVAYPEGAFADESGARLLHYAAGAGAWEDITSPGYPDTAVNVICGLTDSLSPFTVAERTYDLERFAPPVDGPPIVNRAKAGSGIPVKFALVGGDLGLDIFAAGWPRSVATTSCGSTAVDAIEETVSAGSSSLSFDPSTGLYTYVWKTDKAWRGCRTLVLTFRDGSSAQAHFEFRK